jgi:hypothetical protein
MATGRLKISAKGSPEGSRGTAIRVSAETTNATPYVVRSRGDQRLMRTGGMYGKLETYPFGVVMSMMKMIAVRIPHTEVI